MKALITSIILLLVIHIYPKAQDLSDLFPFAHYTLINTPNDALGLQNPMNLVNTVYEGNDGIYFNGKHPVVDQGGSWARTYYMSALFDPKFAVQVEFKIEDLDGSLRCIVICGLSTFTQYLGLFINSNQFSILLSDGLSLALPDLDPQEDVWYKFTMIYDTLSNNAKFYLGSNLIESANHQLVRSPGDAFVNNYFPLGGYPLKGNWRNLRIYGKEEVSALEDELDHANQLTIFPNPAQESLVINTEDKRIKKWRICNAAGQSILSGPYRQHEQLDIHDMVPANYFIQLLDNIGTVLATRTFAKM